MIYMTYISRYKTEKRAHPLAAFESVTTGTLHPLAPSKRLEYLRRHHEITPLEYKQQYLFELERPVAKACFKRLLTILRQGQDLYLVANRKDGKDHRRILKELLEADL